MRMPSHTALCSFMFSMILTSALVPSSGDVALAAAGAPAAQLAVQAALKGLRAEGFSGGARFALPAPAAAPSAAPAPSAATASDPGARLTPDLLSKLLQLIPPHGTDHNIAAVYANALGLTAAGQPWLDRQIVAGPINENVNHGFAVSRGSDQDLLFFLHSGDRATLFRANRDGTVVAALILQAGQIAMRAPAEAQPDLDAEFAYWASAIDGLLAGK